MHVLKAISLKVMSAVLFAVMSALVRFLGEKYPVGQIVFFRSAFAILPVVLIYAWRNELAAAVRTVRPLGHLAQLPFFRAAFEVVKVAADRQAFGIAWVTWQGAVSYAK